MKKLLVGSIFMNTSHLMCKWLDLQLLYLRATTEDFDYVATVTDESYSPYFAERTKVVSGVKNQDVQNFSHMRGLNNLLDYFRQNADRYHYFLFLDMDAFPIRKGWLDMFTGSKLKPEYDIAAPIRSENLETRVHASFLLARRTALDSLHFEISSVGRDLRGEGEMDVNVGKYQTLNRDKVLPLMRSNRYNIHPLLFGIYYDTLYHNACGTGRDFNMRARDYWDHMISPEFDVMKITEELFANPNEFIGRLAGYNPHIYAKV